MRIQSATQFLSPISTAPLWKKALKAISWVALTAISYFVADWLGVAACAITFLAICRNSRKPDPNAPPPRHFVPIPDPRSISPDSLSEPDPSPRSIASQVFNACPPQFILNQAFDPNRFTPVFRHPNKALAYKLLTRNQPLIEQQVQLSKVHMLQLPTSRFLDREIQITSVVGRFTYPADPHHWTANFADSEIFFGSLTGSLRQTDLQALEHPSLSHIYADIRKNLCLRTLDPAGSALIIEGVRRYGKLKIQYAPSHEIGQRDFELCEPYESRIFAIAAPKIHPKNEGRPYQLKDLRALFCSAYAAFSQIAAKDPQAVIHTGNWGCGNDGHDPKTIALIQIAAAKLAGIKTIYYYPMGKDTELKAAQELLKAKNPNLTADGFLRHLATYAHKDGLIYRISRA